VSRDFVLRAAPESALDIDGPLHAALPIASQRWEAIAEAGKAQRSDEAYVRSSAVLLLTAGDLAAGERDGAIAHLRALAGHDHRFAEPVDHLVAALGAGHDLGSAVGEIRAAVASQDRSADTLSPHSSRSSSARPGPGRNPRRNRSKPRDSRQPEEDAHTAPVSQPSDRVGSRCTASSRRGKVPRSSSRSAPSPLEPRAVWWGKTTPGKRPALAHRLLAIDCCRPGPDKIGMLTTARCERRGCPGVARGRHGGE
jgi:hypothetical protein